MSVAGLGWICDPFLSVPDSPVHNKAAYNAVKTMYVRHIHKIECKTPFPILTTEITMCLYNQQDA